MTDVIKEASRAIQSQPEEDVARFGNDTALSERIREWFETPMGTIADKPEWGHNLAPLKFDPLTPDFEVAIEMAITEKMPIDISDLILLGIRVESREIDLCNVVIRHQFGQTLTSLQL